MKVTGEHPFYSNNEWVKVKDLKVGDFLITEDGKKAKITYIKEVNSDESVDVYNLNVDGNDNTMTFDSGKNED